MKCKNEQCEHELTIFDRGIGVNLCLDCRTELRLSKEIELRRKDIDDIDRKLVQLLNLRAILSKRIGELKRENGLPMPNGLMPVDRAREDQILRLVKAWNLGPMDDGNITSIFLAILRECWAVQQIR
jgi:chorismate mutase/prephenate dehydratase